MTTLVASQTHPSPTPSVSGRPLSPDCPHVWTKDVDNIGDNSPHCVRFERSVHLSPSVDHLWTGSREPLVGRSRTCGRNCPHWGRTTDVLSLSPDHRPSSTRPPTVSPQRNSPHLRGNSPLYTESTSPMTVTTYLHSSITTQPSRTSPWISPLVFVNRRLSWAFLAERTGRPVRKGVDE
jgi:hypothetical protein